MKFQMYGSRTIKKPRRYLYYMDHRVGDVGDVELVEADQPEAPRDALPERVQRVRGALEFLQLAVDLAHELVKVQPGLAHQRHRLVKAVHQQALAAADAAPEVDPARDRRLDQQLGDRIAAPRLVRGPFVGAALQRGDRAQLRRIARVAAFGEGALVALGDRRHALAGSCPGIRG